jgi:hypothetical protein
VEILLDGLRRHFGPSFLEIRKPILLAVSNHDLRVFGPMANGLAEHGGHDALRRPLQQLAGEAAADAVAHEEEFADPEMVHQPEMVVGEGVPGVLDRHRASGLAAIGIALVHGDAAEVVLELFHRIENGGLPVADTRIQSAARDDQQREAGADLLIANANVTPLIERHGTLSYL